MTTFPLINHYDAATFRQTSEDPAISPAKMDGGYVISRPRFTRRPRRSYMFTFVEMQDTDMTTLQNFWDTVRGSSNAFNWVHFQTGATINVRFDPATKLVFTRDGYGPVNRWHTDVITLTEV